MNITKRQPVSLGEMITEEFLVPMALTQGQLAEAMGVSRKTVNDLCANRRAITADAALMLATVFGNTADFWLNLQQRNELWKALIQSSGSDWYSLVLSGTGWYLIRRQFHPDRNFFQSFIACPKPGIFR